MNAANESVPCPLAELPDELLLEIISHLALSRGFLPVPELEGARRQGNRRLINDLHCLTLTCQKFNVLATPFLYQAVVQPSTDRFTIYLLIKTIIAKPALAKHIHYIENLADYDSARKWPRDTFKRSDWAVLMRCMNNCEWDPQIQTLDFQKSIFDGRFDLDIKDLGYLFLDSLHVDYRLRHHTHVGLAALIALSTDLEDVAVIEPGFTTFATLGLKKYSRPGGLRRLWIGGSLRENNAHFETVTGSPTWSIPVSDIIWISCWNSHLTTLCILPRSQSHVQELHLESCNWSPSELQEALQPCVSLKHFTCRWKTAHFDPEAFLSDPIPSASIDLPRLASSLEAFHHSLERLVLDTLDSGWIVSMEQDIPPIGSLRQFTRLKHVDVSGLVLWGDVHSDAAYPALALRLPESLEELIIRTEWDDDVEDSLLDLSRDCPTLLPSLRNVDCSWRPAPSSLAEWLKDEFDAATVELILSVLDE